MPQSLRSDWNRDEAFNRITTLMRDIFDVDIAAVSLIEGGRQKFKSIQGLELTEIPLEDSFCRATWREGRPVIIPDAEKNDEFEDHILVTKDPHLRAYAGALLRTSEGEAIGTLCAIHRQPREFTERDLRMLENLAQMAASEFELREFAYRDTLTGALSRRQFLKKFEQLCRIAEKKQLQVSVIMLDVDHFKSVNDRFGHAAGDEVLRAIVAACKANLRDFDLLGRLGGEEFAIALEGSSQKSLMIAERLRRVVSRLHFKFDDTPVQVTSSFGVAAVLPEDENIHAAILRADKALYHAKSEGRDRVVISRDLGGEHRLTSSPNPCTDHRLAP